MLVTLRWLMKDTWLQKALVFLCSNHDISQGGGAARTHLHLSIFISISMSTSTSMSISTIYEGGHSFTCLYTSMLKNMGDLWSIQYFLFEIPQQHLYHYTRIHFIFIIIDTSFTFLGYSWFSSSQGNQIWIQVLMPWLSNGLLSLI